MASFERLSVQRARRPSADGGEGSVWRRFRHPLTFRHKAAPTHVEFSPVAPHDFAVASSLQVDVFSTRTTAIYRSLTRFKDVVHCCSYRGDGKMLAAGDDAGTVQIFDLGSRAVMRTFRGHQRAVHVARFTPDGSNVFTASDDQRAICWDVAAETQVRRFDGHTDFVRCGALNPNSPKLLVTGSYDHTVRLWDVNSPKCIMELQHAAPVEDLVLLPGGGMLATASGNTMSVWDILSGGRVLQTVCAHSKTITSLCADASGSHLLSASLDHMVKVYELRRYKVVGSLKYAAPLLSVALSPASSHLVVGMSDNSLCVRRQATGSREAGAGGAEARSRNGEASDLQNVGLPGQVAADKSAPLPQDGSTYRYFLRGRNHAPQPGQMVVERASANRLSSFDKALKSFKYHEAFDAALINGSPDIVVAVIEELVQRNGLRIALQGRDQHTLEPVVAFLVRQITAPPFAAVLIGVANLLLDMYAPVLGKSAAIDELFVKLRNTLEAEMRLQAELAQLMGAMDVLLAGAMPTVGAKQPLPPAAHQPGQEALGSRPAAEAMTVTER